jgi:hypothetical protein
MASLGPSASKSKIIFYACVEEGCSAPLKLKINSI